jgi:hypothetical protein
LLLEASNKWPLNANCQIAPKTIQLLIQTVGDCNNKIGGSQFSGEWGRVKGIRKWECGSGNLSISARPGATCLAYATYIETYHNDVGFKF